MADSRMHAALLSWYERTHRDLPWRRTQDPYAILVSEVMLQQTQVVRVVPRYEVWLERWPDAASLAAAPRARVLGAWVGLGYNARAVRLHEACAIVASGGWPRTVAGLRALPGIGPYTAAAVASFAFGEHVAAVDTNVRRVAQRLGAGTPDALLAPGRAADWNQAMIELGARVCTAREARCTECPIAAHCASRGLVSARPRAPSGSRVRFEDTNRWVRGRIVAALAEDGALPCGIEPARLELALAQLCREGLVALDEAGARLA